MFMAEKRGMFIVFDGGDGTGKTTQAKMIVELLKKQGKKVIFTHEPMRNTELGLKIEKAIRQKNPPSKEELLSLFTMDREYHLKHEIIPALENGTWVVCDRYYYSTMSYQLPETKWNEYAKRFLKPDLTLIFDVTEKIAMQRIEKSLSQNERRHKEKAMFEKENVLGELRQKYLNMKRFSEIRIIDAAPDINTIFESVKKEVEKLI
jgi:dTMP kinase